MDVIENVIIEFHQDDNVVYVTREDYLDKNFKLKTKYLFSYGTLSGVRKTRINTYYKSINGVMKQFNKAVEAIKNGTQIK
jgi:hypothetical protein